VLPHGSNTLAGKPATSYKEHDYDGTALVRVVFPFELVTEFDTWLADTLHPQHIERPNKIIDEYSKADGDWAGFEGLQVIYYIVVKVDQLEEIEKFAEIYSDQR
jgi:hypothetical protein